MNNLKRFKKLLKNKDNNFEIHVLKRVNNGFDSNIILIQNLTLISFYDWINTYFITDEDLARSDFYFHIVCKNRDSHLFLVSDEVLGFESYELMDFLEAIRKNYEEA